MVSSENARLCECPPNQPAHNAGCPVGNLEFQAHLAAEYEAQKAACARMGHPFDERLGGVGFGLADFFCDGCGALTRTVPVTELSPDETHRVAELVNFLGTEPPSLEST